MSVDNANNLVAVTVTYNVDNRFETALGSYLNQVARVIIVDNSSDPQRRERLAALAGSAGERVSLIQNGQNLGLGRAQNIG
ncbi:MAG: glycosyltransferase, partial [Candidatus Thiodiazotropha sp.]